MPNPYFDIKKIVFNKRSVEIYTSELSEFDTSAKSQFIENYILYYNSVLHHTCVNKYGKTFESCMQYTSISHFFEHAVIQELVNRDSPSSTFKFCGYTKLVNSDSPYLNYCITLNYQVDIDALFAIKAAIAKFDKFFE